MRVTSFNNDHRSPGICERLWLLARDLRQTGLRKKKRKLAFQHFQDTLKVLSTFRHLQNADCTIEHREAQQLVLYVILFRFAPSHFHSVRPYVPFLSRLRETSESEFFLVHGFFEILDVVSCRPSPSSAPAQTKAPEKKKMTSPPPFLVRISELRV